MKVAPKAWKNVPSELNSGGNNITPLKDINEAMPSAKVNIPIKKDSNINNSTGNSTFNNLTGPAEINNTLNSTQDNSHINQIDSNIGNSMSNSNPLGMNSYGNGINSFGSGYGMGGSYGGYGMGGGSYGMGGGYGMGGFGGYGMSGGYGMGGSYGMPGMNKDPNNPDFLDKCFYSIERMNFQLFHLCELARMIHQQSTALAYLFDLFKKGYSLVNNFAKDKIMSLIYTIKKYSIDKIIQLKKFTKEFLNKSNNQEDTTLKSHIKLLDRALFILIIISSSTLIAKAIAIK